MPSPLIYNIKDCNEAVTRRNDNKVFMANFSNAGFNYEVYL